MTLSEFIEIYKKRKTGKDSLDRDIQHLSYIVELMGNKRLQAYREDDFQELEEKFLAKERTPSAVNRYFQVLHQIRDNAKPGENVKSALYDLALFGLCTGARLSEIVFLRHDQIDGDIARLKISETKFRKRGKRSSIKEKLIYLSPEALAIILRQKKSKDGFVFPLKHRYGRVISKAIHTMRKDLGVIDFTNHSLRHTFVSRATSLGDTATVRPLVGHSDYRTTLRYTHPEQAQKRAITTKLGTRIRSIDISPKSAQSAPKSPKRL